MESDRWYKENKYLYYEDCIVVPEARLDGCLQWARLSSGHTGYNRSVEVYRKRFYVITEGDYLLLSFISTHFRATARTRKNEVQNPKSHKLISFNQNLIHGG